MLTIFDNISLNQSQNSNVIDVEKTKSSLINISWSGTPNGSLYLKTSNNPLSDFQKHNDTVIAVTGQDTAQIEIWKTTFQYFVLQFDYNSGDGNLSATIQRNY